MTEERVPINQQIKRLLAERGPLSMTRIAIEIGRNAGSTRVRVLTMETRGEVVRLPHPQNPDWSLFGLPEGKKEKAK